MNSKIYLIDDKPAIDVLDNGYVIFKDFLGDDLKPVNAAKVSYDKESKTFGEREERLLKFLGREDHTSPFRHAVLQFECFAPLMVARQWWKYIVGSAHKEFEQDNLQDPFTAWNESSRRYISEEPVFYLPTESEWRGQPANSKQGSNGFVPLEIGAEATKRLIETQTKAIENYEWAIENDIATEQARLFLPAYGLYVRWYWTASLQGVAHFLNQRLSHDAQKEIQDFAQAVDELSRTVFPIAIEQLTKGA